MKKTEYVSKKSLREWIALQMGIYTESAGGNQNGYHGGGIDVLASLDDFISGGKFDATPPPAKPAEWLRFGDSIIHSIHGTSTEIYGALIYHYRLNREYKHDQYDSEEQAREAFEKIAVSLGAVKIS